MPEFNRTKNAWWGTKRVAARLGRSWLGRTIARAVCASRFWAILAVLVVGAAAYWALGPFVQPPSPSKDLLGSLFGDRVVVGGVHVVVIAAALYIVASIAALIAEGRWINEIGSGGAKVDAAKAGSAALEDLKTQLAEAKHERDTYKALAERSADITQKLGDGLLKAVMGDPAASPARQPARRQRKTDAGS